MKKAQVFISYARQDDEPFVEALYHDLEAKGITVWWDRKAMESRERTFLQEIRDAIEGVDRVIAVIGPAATSSEYVRYEWGYARLFAKALVPILRLGNYMSVPSDSLGEAAPALAADDISKLHCIDFRAQHSYDAALDELIAIIQRPVPPLASYDGTPAPPPHFLPRSKDLRRLREAVLADAERPTIVDSTRQIVGLHGMAGVGKSVIAAAFARMIDTRRAFTDGIVWLTAGQQADERKLLENIRAVGDAFNDSPKYYEHKTKALRRLPKLLKEKVCLIVLDDVWSVEQVAPLRNALGERCRLLFTTREGSAVSDVGAIELSVDVLSESDAKALLADWFAATGKPLPTEAIEVAKLCGNLPFTLALCGAVARDGQPWRDILDALLDADHQFIERRFPDYPFPDALRAMRASVDMLGRENATAVDRYHELAVFLLHPVSEEAVVTFWCRENVCSARNARKLLTILARKSLLSLQGEAPKRLVVLHDLQRDYLRLITDDYEVQSLNSLVLKNYRKRCPRGWASGPDDGYFFQMLPPHLIIAGKRKELHRLLLNPVWILTVLKTTSTGWLIASYDLPPGDIDERIIRQALAMSQWVLDNAARPHLACQLAGQLVGRLRSIPRRSVHKLVASIERCGWAPCLIPQTQSLKLVGDPSHWHRLDGQWRVWSVAAPPDGQLVLSSSGSLVNLWDLATGELIKTLRGHEGAVFAMAVLPDSRRVLSGCADRTVRMWGLDKGELIRTLTGHEDWVTGVAVLPDGRRALSASGDRTLRLWDLETGKTLRTLTGHEDCVTGVAVLPDGRRALSASGDRTLRLWDLETGKTLRKLVGHESFVNTVAVLPDGRRAISGSSDYTLRLWDLETCETILKLHPMGEVLGVAVLPGGQRAVSGSFHTDPLFHTIKMWDLETGDLITFFAPDSGVTSIAAAGEDICIAAATIRGRCTSFGSYSNLCILPVWCK